VLAFDLGMLIGKIKSGKSLQNCIKNCIGTLQGIFQGGIAIAYLVLNQQEWL